MKKPLRLAIVGDGPTAAAHTNAFKAIGHNVLHCSAGMNSKTLSRFAKKHDIKNTWANSQKLISSYDEWDGIIIAASISALPSLLDEAMKSEKPILIEKPVSTKSDYLKQFQYNTPKNIMVGYNRRFYSTIIAAKTFLSSKSEGSFCFMELPETIDFNQRQEKTYLPIYNNSCHGIDILHFLLGELKVKHVETIRKNGLDLGRYIIIEAGKNKCFLSLNWNSPSNFSLNVEHSEERISLRPFENYEYFKGMQVEEPSTNFPMRKYSPISKTSFNVFETTYSGIKPGFLEQAQEFISLIEGNFYMNGASLADAFYAQYVLEDILNR